MHHISYRGELANESACIPGMLRRPVSLLQRLFHASDSGGLQRAVDVIERAAVSMAHLRPYRERQEVSWVVRHNVDVYGCGLLAGLAVLWCVVAAVSVVVRLAVRGMERVKGASRRKSRQAQPRIEMSDEPHETHCSP